MNFNNQSMLPAAWTMGFQGDGRELLVVIVKATYMLPAAGESAILAAEQVPLVGPDEFHGEPGLSAPRLETDYAHRKALCDVLLVGSAYAPSGQRLNRCVVSLEVGAMAKRFAVIGPRTWVKRFGAVAATSPEPSNACLSYDVAWGGTDRTREPDGMTDAYPANPVGQGFWRHTDHIEGRPLPQTEAIGQAVDSPQGNYLPQALSPIGRNWIPRRGFAGTYDEAWLETRAPLWPEDFDERYFQSAPADQTIPYPTGGEKVVLGNLTPDGHRAFQLPTHPMPVTFIPHKGRDLNRVADIDTIVFEPDANRLTMTYRCTLPLARSVFDVREVVAGEMSAAWHRSRKFPGKVYHASLADALRANSQRRGAGVTGVSVLASGMVTPLGYNAHSTLAALRAGVSAIRKLPWLDRVSGEPFKGARVSLPHWWFGVGMLADMVTPAIEECLDAARPGAQPEDVPLLLGVSAPDRPGRPSGLDGTLLDEIASRLKLTPHRMSAVYPFDQFGCAHAFAVARDLLTSGRATRVVIAGVDSFLNASTLHAMNDRRRINTPANSNGFFPGEAGAAVLVGASEAGAGDGGLEILGVGVAREPAPIEGTAPFQAQGLTQACRTALEEAGVKMRDVAVRVTDLSGEHYKFKEAAFVAGRLDTSARSTPLDLWHPIQYFGDVGAAILPCLLAQALHAGRHGYAPGPISLCHVGSDAGERAALVARYDGPRFTEDEE